MARGAWGFGLARALLGISESPNYPAAAKIIAEWFPRRERAFAFGFINAGTNMGAILAPAAVPVLAATFGWQSAFIALGAIGLAWLCVWIPVYRSPQEHPRVSPEELALIHSDPPEPTVKVPWLELLRYRQAWAFGPSGTDTVLRYAGLLVQTGRAADARIVAQTCLKLDPGDTAVRALLKKME